MKIIIEGDELQQALEHWVNQLGMNTTGKNVDVTFTAGRGVNATSATVSITQGNDEEPSNVPTPREVAAMLDSVEVEEEEPEDDVDPFSASV